MVYQLINMCEKSKSNIKFLKNMQEYYQFIRKYNIQFYKF